MKAVIKICFLFLIFNLQSCKKLIQNTEGQKLTTVFDFSTIEKFRNTKSKGLIINDYDNLFTTIQINELSDIINNYNLKTTRQIVLVTIDSITPYTDIQKYATDLSNYWGVGTSEKNNGLTILLCKSCKKITIVTGTDTQLILTDEICKKVIDETIIPEFKQGNYYTGIKNGILELINMW